MATDCQGRNDGAGDEEKRERYDTDDDNSEVWGRK